MSHRHTHDDPRHARVFALLRQPQQITPASQVKDRFQFRKATPQEIEAIKNRASETLIRRH